MKRTLESIDLPLKTKVSSGLHLIQEYDNDDDEDCEPISAGTEESCDIVKIISPKRIKKFKSPFEVSTMFQPECDENTDDVNLHGGRIRSFAHVRGNWASFIALPFPGDCDNIVAMDEILTDVVSLQHMSNIDLVTSPHVSLSKTIVFRHHWLESFIQELKTQLVNRCDRFMVTFDEFEVYINDEKTRTFIGMKIHSSPALIDLLKKCDSCLTEYNLECYYKNPSFHVSLAWVVGDHFATISKDILPQVNTRWRQLLKQDESLKFYTVKLLEFKYGNKVATFNLN